MRSQFAVFVFVVGLIYTLGLAAQPNVKSASKAEKLRKVTMYYPSGYEDLSGDYKSRVQKIFKEVNIDLTFKAVPSERGINMLKSGESAAELARSADIVDIVQGNYFFIPTPLDVLELSYIYKDDKFKKFEDLDRTKVVVGYMQGGRTSKNAAEKFSHVHALKDQDTLYKMLDTKRMDLFFILTNKKQRATLLQRGFQVGFINKHPIYTFLRRDLEAYRDKLSSAYLREFKH